MTQNRVLFSDNQFDNTIKRRPSNEKVLSGLDYRGVEHVIYKVGRWLFCTTQHTVIVHVNTVVNGLYVSVYGRY